MISEMSGGEATLSSLPFRYETFLLSVVSAKLKWTIAKRQSYYGQNLPVES